MNTILRTLIVWLVLLAVPFQGFASAAMPGCANGHALPAPQMPEAAAGHAVHGHHDAGPGAADHGAHARAAMDQHDGLHEMDHHGSAKCGACSACSIGAAMAPAAALALAVHAPAALTVPFALEHLPAVDLALPERPPRFFLA